jgi:glycosyltransferase involved in cell wall biosynthesis
MNIYYVAAFADPMNRSWFSLGRQRKTDLVITLLSGLGYHLTSLNIAPSDALYSSSSVVGLCLNSFLPLRLLQLLLFSTRFFLKSTDRHSTGIIWLYNTRVAESLVAIVAVLLRPHFKLVLQLEDLPSARAANHGLRGLADSFSTRLLSKRANYVFAVSKNVASSFSRLTHYPIAKVALLPPSIDPVFTQKAEQRADPFSKRHIVILYAGSYEPEKGVTDLIQAFLQLDKSLFRLLLAGSAPVELVKEYADSPEIRFTGVVDCVKLFHFYTTADVVVNPHRPILTPGNVFPFKLVETVASGALPLTTPVPGSEFFDLPPDCFFSGVDELAYKLSNARLIWQRNRQQLQRCSAACLACYSSQAIQSNVRKVLIPD